MDDTDFDEISFEDFKTDDKEINLGEKIQDPRFVASTFEPEESRATQRRAREKQLKEKREAKLAEVMESIPQSATPEHPDHMVGCSLEEEQHCILTDWKNSNKTLLEVANLRGISREQVTVMFSTKKWFIEVEKIKRAKEQGESISLTYIKRDLATVINTTMKKMNTEEEPTALVTLSKYLTLANTIVQQEIKGNIVPEIKGLDNLNSAMQNPSTSASGCNIEINFQRRDDEKDDKLTKIIN